MTNFNKKWNQYLQESDLEITNFDSQDDLNPKIWSGNELDREISQVLMKVALDFHKSLDIGDQFEDIRFTGSNASYFWTDLSDIDLHIIVGFSKFGENAELIKDLVNLKRSQWNSLHQIKIFDHEVEVYVQDENEPHYTAGEYSLLRQEWVQAPSKDAKNIDYRLIRVKSEAFADEIDAVETLFRKKDYNRAYEQSLRLKNKIKKMRHAGLSSKGIFSLENLSFKVLRNNDYINKLFGLLNSSYDRKMSISEVKKHT
jgi:hypothetical protein